MFTTDENATSASLIALMIGGLLFSASMGTVLLLSDGAADEAAQSETGQAFTRAQAGDLANLLFKSPGATTLGVDWAPLSESPETAAYPDAVSRLGLVNPNTKLLSFEKFENLRLAPETPDPLDGYVNYEEARASLGLDTAGLDFHVRAFPSLRSVQEILETGKKDDLLRVAYIGHQTGGNGNGAGGITIPIANVACAAKDTDLLEISLDVTNNGDAETMFELAADMQFTAGNLRLQDVTTPIAIAGIQTVTFDAPAITGRTCDDLLNLDVEIHDITGLLEKQVGVPVTMGANPSIATQEFHLLVPGWVKNPGDEITLDFDYANKDDWIRVVIREGSDPANTIVHQPADFQSKNSNSQQKYDIPASTLSQGDYTAYVTHLASGETLTGTLIIRDPGNEPGPYVPPGGSPPVEGTYTWDASAGIEADMVAGLVEKFCPYNHNSDTIAPGSPEAWVTRCAGFKPASEGDVFPDDSTPLQAELVPRLYDGGAPSLDQISVLVVGSNVQHNPMVHIKSEVEEWVIAGGTLVVFGSDDSNTQWMQSLFHIGISTSSTGLNVNDADHPVLHVADTLVYQDYDNRGQSWQFTGDAADKFSNVLGLGGDTALTLNHPGSYGRGNVIATTFFPYDIFNNGGADGDEGLRLMNNILMLGYRTLYLDYGPQLPEGKEVLPSVARASILHPDLGIVALDLKVFVWET